MFLILSSGVKVYVDSRALMHVIGTEMDFVTDRIRSEFVFSNPNSKVISSTRITAHPGAAGRVRVRRELQCGLATL